MISPGNYFGHCFIVEISGDMSLALNEIPVRMYVLRNNTGVTRTVTMPSASTLSRYLGITLSFYNIGDDSVILGSPTLATLASGEMTTLFLAVDASGNSWETSSVNSYFSS